MVASHATFVFSSFEVGWEVEAWPHHGLSGLGSTLQACLPIVVVAVSC